MMIDFNKKRLNNKGFTLIELLAVVVILAIVLGIVGVPMLSSVNNTKRSTLHSTAKTTATNLNTWITEDELVFSGDEKKIGQDFLDATMTGNWICFSNNLTINNGGQTTTLMSALGLSATDIVLGTNFTSEAKGANGVATGDPTCSAIRYNTLSGGYEVVLVAAPNGKYHVSGDKVHFAYSSANAVNESIG